MVGGDVMGYFLCFMAGSIFGFVVMAVLKVDDR